MEFAKNLGVKSFICCPIVYEKESLGVLAVENIKTKRPLIQSDANLLMGIAPGIGISIHNSMLIEARERQFKSIMLVLAASIDARDTLTAGHSDKVTEYALGICNELGIPKDYCEVIRVAALLHDYGKIGIEDAILKKKGKLNPDERLEIETHAEKTKKILEQIHLKDYTSWSSGTLNVPNWCYVRTINRTNKDDVTLGQLWPYHKQRALYWCPTEITNTAFFRAREQQVCSYTMNGSVSSFGTSPTGKPYVSHKMARFKPHFMLYWESDERQPSYYDNVASRPDEGASLRHGGGIVMGMFGGQTEFIKFRAYAMEAGLGGFRGNRPGRMWCNPNSPTGD